MRDAGAGTSGRGGGIRTHDADPPKIRLLSAELHPERRGERSEAGAARDRPGRRRPRLVACDDRLPCAGMLGEILRRWTTTTRGRLRELFDSAGDPRFVASAGVVGALDRIGYDGWIMVEQDSSWLPPAEASEIGLRALRAALDSAE